jgi:ribonuclease HI
MSTSTKNQVYIATDGCCKGNPGPGGWAAVIWNEYKKKVIYGYAEETTNNRMELIAAISALNYLKFSCQVTIISDSRYVVDGITIWIHSWIRKSFKDVKNQDLWEQLLNSCVRHQIQWKWVKGHAGHVANELADKYSCGAIDKKSSGEVELEIS